MDGLTGPLNPRVKDRIPIHPSFLDRHLHRIVCIGFLEDGWQEAILDGVSIGLRSPAVALWARRTKASHDDPIPRVSALSRSMEIENYARPQA
jgi:hypothetical protein